MPFDPIRGFCRTGAGSAPNSAPTVTTSGGNTAYTQFDAATAVDAALTVADSDDSNLESATVAITSGAQLDDALTKADANGITWSWIAPTVNPSDQFPRAGFHFVFDFDFPRLDVYRFSTCKYWFSTRSTAVLPSISGMRMEPRSSS